MTLTKETMAMVRRLQPAPSTIWRQPQLAAVRMILARLSLTQFGRHDFNLFHDEYRSAR